MDLSGSQCFTMKLAKALKNLEERKKDIKKERVRERKKRRKDGRRRKKTKERKQDGQRKGGRKKLLIQFNSIFLSCLPQTKGQQTIFYDRAG